MPIVLRKVGDVTILDISGKLSIQEGTWNLRQMIDFLITHEDKKVLLNLTGISYADTSGLGELVKSFISLANCGGALRLLTPSIEVRKKLLLAKLDTVFKIFENEEEAVKSFS